MDQWTGTIEKSFSIPLFVVCLLYVFPNYPPHSKGVKAEHFGQTIHSPSGRRQPGGEKLASLSPSGTKNQQSR